MVLVIRARIFRAATIRGGWRIFLFKGYPGKHSLGRLLKALFLGCAEARCSCGELCCQPGHAANYAVASLICAPIDSQHVGHVAQRAEDGVDLGPPTLHTNTYKTCCSDSETKLSHCDPLIIFKLHQILTASKMRSRIGQAAP